MAVGFTPTVNPLTLYASLCYNSHVINPKNQGGQVRER